MSSIHHNHANKFNLAFLLAIGLNLTLTVVQGIYAILSNSSSLLADAGHNLGDVSGLVIAWIAILLLKRKSCNQYSYGFKKTTILAALINSLILVLASIFILFESMKKLIYVEEVNAFYVIIIAAIGVFINIITSIPFIKGSKKDLNIRGAFLHLIFDAIISFGVVVSGIIIYFTNWNIIDPIVGIIITILIIVGTWNLLKQSLNLVMDGVPKNIDFKKVKKYLSNLPNVIEVHDLHIWALSTNENALTTHLVMSNKIHNFSYLKIQKELQKKFDIQHTTIQLEENYQSCLNSCN